MASLRVVLLLFFSSLQVDPKSRDRLKMSTREFYIPPPPVFAGHEGPKSKRPLTTLAQGSWLGVSNTESKDDPEGPPQGVSILAGM